MAHLTYTFKLLQTKGRKGKALHEAMRRWTQAHTEFLDLAAAKVDAFEAACTAEGPRGPRRSKLSLQKWIRQEIKALPSYAALECSMKDALITLLGGQLMSFLELRNVQDNTGFPSGRGYSQLQFEHYVYELISRDWTLGNESEELEYATVQGKVQGYRPKSIYSPIEFCRYDMRRNYFLAKSEDDTYFAGLFLTTEDTGFRLNGTPLEVVGKDCILKSLSKKAVLVPLGTGKWVIRKLKNWRPETARLIYREGEFYLHVAFEAPDAEPKPWQTIIGVDRGKFRLASYAVVTETGKLLTKDSFIGFGLHPKRVKEINAKIQSAQANGGHFKYKYGTINSEAAHTVANQLIALAKRHKGKIVMEDLENMMHSMMAKTPKSNFNKGRKSNIYAELLRVLEYKCARLGIEMEKVGAAYTSQTCPECGCIDKHNRLTIKQTQGGKETVSREKFNCINCSFDDDDADAVAAINIARKAIFKQACIEDKKQGNKLTWPEFASKICSV